MKNTIDAHIEFSFKGEIHSLTSSIDLDQFIAHGHTFSSLHAILAQDNQIDTYSYMYEVMQEEEFEFKNPHGLAAEFLNDGVFDLDGFSAVWQERKIIALLQPVVMREMGIADLDQNPGLKSVLFQAYKLGRST